MIEIVEQGGDYYIRLTEPYDYDESGMSDDYESILHINRSWEENCKRVTGGVRKSSFPIDKYIYEHPEEFKELFNKAKVKYML